MMRRNRSRTRCRDDAGCRVWLDEIRLIMDLTRCAGRSGATEKTLKAQIRRLLTASDRRPWVLFAAERLRLHRVGGDTDIRLEP